MLWAYITLGILAFILIGCLLALAWIGGWLHANKEYLDDLQRQHSWSSVMVAQFAFNLDFFDELWANNDPRLTIG